MLKDLKVPPSGIFLLEEWITLQGGPDIVTLTDEVQAPTSIIAVLYYTANMHLYKVLNDICANLKEAESTFNHPACSSYVTFYAELPLGTEGYTLNSCYITTLCPLSSAQTPRFWLGYTKEYLVRMVFKSFTIASTARDQYQRWCLLYIERSLTFLTSYTQRRSSYRLLYIL